jgi:hypothetical protein
MQLRRWALLTGFALCGVTFAAQSCDPQARVFFIKPYNGASVTSPFRVIFGAELVAVEATPAGRIPENVGHHDLLINLGNVPEGQLIPTDRQHLNFDQGQSQAEVTLPPGSYQLTLQFADGAERSHGPAMSATIHVTVEKPAGG